MRYLALLLLIPAAVSAENCYRDMYGNISCYENPAISSGRNVGRMLSGFGSRPSVVQGANDIRMQRMQIEQMQLENALLQRQIEQLEELERLKRQGRE